MGKDKVLYLRVTVRQAAMYAAAAQEKRLDTAEWARRALDAASMAGASSPRGEASASPAAGRRRRRPTSSPARSKR
jgi:hypothetical protein